MEEGTGRVGVWLGRIFEKRTRLEAARTTQRPEGEKEDAMKFCASHLTPACLTVIVMSIAAPFAVAQESQPRVLQGQIPYEYSVPLQSSAIPGPPRRLINQNGLHPQFAPGARIIVPARMHREVEVSRSLAAQPVHPHLVKVVLGEDSVRLSPGGSPHNVGGVVLSTYIDPLQRLDGNRGLDENHSLVRAQRQYLALRGVTTEQINAIRSSSDRARAEQLAPANRARIVVAPTRQVHADEAPKPLMILPVPHRQPKPDSTTPSGEVDPKLVARGDAMRDESSRAAEPKSE